MSVFSVKCPNCGISLDAEEQYIGAKVKCFGCGFKFILQDPHESVSAIKLQQFLNCTTDHTDAQSNSHSSEITFDFPILLTHWFLTNLFGCVYLMEHFKSAVGLKFYLLAPNMLLKIILRQCLLCEM